MTRFYDPDNGMPVGDRPAVVRWRSAETKPREASPGRASESDPGLARWITAERGTSAESPRGSSSPRGRSGAPSGARWVSAESGSVTGRAGTERPDATVEVVQDGDTSKSDPFTIVFVANPALEAPWNSGVFVRDPITTAKAAYDACVAYAVDSLMGRRAGQAERFLADAALNAQVRILSWFGAGFPVRDEFCLAAQDGISNLLIARRATIRQFLADTGLAADVVFAVSNSASHSRASAWFTSDDDSRPGRVFSMDGVTRSHRYYSLIPGAAAIHSSARSLTALHEFGHALSSYTNGSVVDLYVDSAAAANNKRGRPIPGTFATYQGSVLKSDPTRANVGYPAGWQSYHCELVNAASPAVMDDYYLGPTGSDSCRHDSVTSAFLTDRVRAKMSR